MQGALKMKLKNIFNRTQALMFNSYKKRPNNVSSIILIIAVDWILIGTTEEYIGRTQKSKQ